REPRPSPDGPGTRLWPECTRSAGSGSPRNPWVSWGGEHRSARIRGPREIADFVGWEMARGKGPPRGGDATGRIRGLHEACFVGWIGVRDPATLLQQPPPAR